MVYLFLLINLAYSLRKYPLHLEDQALPTSSSNGIENAKTLFAVTIQVGEPGQNISAILVMDDKKDLILASVQEDNPSEISLYNSSASKTYHEINDDYMLGDDKVELGYDKVSFGSLIANNQSFYIVDLDDDSKYDRSVLPLWFDSKNNSKNFLNTLKNEQKIEANVFSIDLWNMVLTIGDRADQDKNPEEAIKIPINTETWTCSFSNISLQGIVLDENSTFNLAIEQEGIVGPSDKIALLRSIIAEDHDCDSKNQTCQCRSDFADFPNIEFLVEGQILIIDPHNYMQYQSEYCTFDFYEGDKWILGQGLFIEYFSVFDHDEGSATFYRVHYPKVEESGFWIGFGLIAIGVIYGIALVFGIVWYCMKDNSRDYTKI
ncbi:hypothetical protein SteCoe_13096 [Stentor coeruleus]|uniref:Peptidase A1 domain-containing protein n=1 Tax=Stentor coeruleus TaxID=5963 RepID=A0A1R2C976_9CILI|nr:hypothetical protein SteCoe_13096 [Stentor coeruleus]